jgi:lipopolysaccharide exporter
MSQASIGRPEEPKEHPTPAEETTDDSPGAEDLRAAAVSGIRWSSIARPTTEIIQLGSIVILARLIVPGEFGRYAIALVAQEVAYLIVAGGLSNALVQRKTLRREHLQTGLGLGLIAGLVIGGAMLVSVPLLFRPLFGARTAFFVELMTPLCLVSAMGLVPTALLRRQMAFRRLSEIEVLNTVVRVVFCIVLALVGLKGEALVLGVVAGSLAMTIVACISAPQPPPKLERQAARDLLDYGLPASMAAVSWVGFNNIDYAIIGARLGAVRTGLYFRAYTLAVEYQSKVGIVMTQVGFPVLARTRDAADLTGHYRQMVRLLTIVLFPMLVLLTIVAPLLVPFLFGSRWSAAIVPVQILALGGASTVVVDAVGTVLMATGRARALLGYGVGHFLAYGLAVLLVVPLGIVAVAIAAAVVHTLFLGVAYALMLHGSGERPLPRLWDDIAPATVSCLGLVAVALPVNLALSLVSLPAIIQLSLVALIALPPYLLTLRICFPKTSRSLRLITERLLPEHRRLSWAKRRLAIPGAEGTL